MLIVQDMQASGGGLKARYAKVNEALDVPSRHARNAGPKLY
jgi:hypothetical protein